MRIYHLYNLYFNSNDGSIYLSIDFFIMKNILPLSIFSCLLLTACGGGGSSSSPVTQAAPTVVDSPISTFTAPTPTTS